MIDILLTTIIISLTVLGARLITDKGMVGEPIRNKVLLWVRNGIHHEACIIKSRELLMKPIILCCVCMPSVWGLAIHLLLHGWSDIQYYPLEALSAAFINGVLWNVYEIINET